MDLQESYRVVTLHDMGWLYTSRYILAETTY